MKSDHPTRDGILKQLSDDEIASVSTAETVGRLAHGDEYLDLARLRHGVGRALGATTPMARVVPRRAVHEALWGKLTAHLARSYEPLSAV